MADSELLRLGRPAETDLLPCPQVIEPAKGRERSTLEQQIHGLLTNDSFNPLGFASFVDRMITFLGGAKERIKLEGIPLVKSMSPVILDHDSLTGYNLVCLAGSAGRQYTLRAGPDWLWLLPYPQCQEVIDEWGEAITRDNPIVEENLSVMVSGSGGISHRVTNRLLPRNPTGYEQVIPSLLLPRGIPLAKALEGGSEVDPLDVLQICRTVWNSRIKASTDGHASFYAVPLSVVGHL